MSSKPIITFSLGDKDISIQCPKNQKMKDVCQVFANKIGLDINSLSFLYGGNQINLELSFEDLALPNDKTNNKIKIIVIKDKKEEKYCPLCAVKTTLNTKEIEFITKSNNTILDGINEIQKNIEKLVNICYIESIKIQLRNIYYTLSSINTQVENYNKNLRKSFNHIIKFDNLKIDENKINIKNDNIDKDNKDNKEKELYEKQQKELEMKKKLEEEEKKKLLVEEEKKKNLAEQMKKKLEDEEIKKKEQMEKEKNKKLIEELNAQKKQVEINKLKQNQNQNQINLKASRYTMSSPDLGYVCTCTNLMILQQYIYVGTDFAEIPLMLKNEGSYDWPQNKTKIVFDKKYEIKGNDVLLNSIKPGAEQQCTVKIEGLKNLPVGEYETGVYFNIKGKNCGDIMKMKIIIINKEVDPKIKYKNTLKQFRGEYNLEEGEYPDDDLIDILLSNNLDLEKAFMCLIGET